jgi:hypothetical protein
MDALIQSALANGNNFASWVSTTAMTEYLSKAIFDDIAWLVLAAILLLVCVIVLACYRREWKKFKSNNLVMRMDTNYSYYTRSSVDDYNEAQNYGFFHWLFSYTEHWGLGMFLGFMIGGIVVIVFGATTDLIQVACYPNAYVLSHILSYIK